jgi:oligopeptide transport system substrate-binding protein
LGRAWFRLVGLVLGAGLITAAGFAGHAEKKGATLRLAAPVDVRSVDPALAYDPDTWAIEFATCSKLYSYPDQPGSRGATVIPEVARGFPRVSKDGRTQTIELKRTYSFHTGRRVSAANFVAAFNRDANPTLQSPATQYLHEIVGADAVIAGGAARISGVRALGAYKLRIRTTLPVPDLVSRLTMPFFCPIATNTPLAEIGQPLGSGPYYIASRTLNRKLVLERNRFYRGPRPARVARVVRTIVGLEACRVAIERNQVDLCGVPSADYAELASKYGINRKHGRFLFHPTLSTYYFAFNHDRRAFNGRGQIPLKQAINLALDRRALVQAAGFLGGKPADQILPPALGRGANVYPLGRVTARRLAKARALLAKAKFGPKQLVLYTPSYQPPAAWARIFQLNLKRLGIEVEVKYFPNYYQMIPKIATRGEPFDVAVLGFIADYADPFSFFSALRGTNIRQAGNTNFAYFNRSKYNRAIARIAGLGGKAGRRAWADLDVEMMRDDPPYAPFMNQTHADFISRSFGCYVFHPVFWLDIAAACKK